MCLCVSVLCAKEGQSGVLPAWFPRDNGDEVVRGRDNTYLLDVERKSGVKCIKNVLYYFE